MALNIKSAETDRLVRDLASLTGESITQAVEKAVSERLERVRRGESLGRRALLRAIQQEVAAMPVLDDRSDDELLGYDEDGLLR